MVLVRDSMPTSATVLPPKFGREYLRAFGAPPRADAERLRHTPVA